MNIKTIVITRPYNVYAENGSWILWAANTAHAIRIAREDCGAIGAISAHRRIHS